MFDAIIEVIRAGGYESFKLKTWVTPFVVTYHHVNWDTDYSHDAGEMIHDPSQDKSFDTLEEAVEYMLVETGMNLGKLGRLLHSRPCWKRN